MLDLLSKISFSVPVPSHTPRSVASEKRVENSVSTFGRFRLWNSFESSPVSVEIKKFWVLLKKLPKKSSWIQFGFTSLRNISQRIMLIVIIARILLAWTLEFSIVWLTLPNFSFSSSVITVSSLKAILTPALSRSDIVYRNRIMRTIKVSLNQRTR